MLRPKRIFDIKVDKTVRTIKVDKKKVGNFVEITFTNVITKTLKIISTICYNTMTNYLTLNDFKRNQKSLNIRRIN